MAKYDLSANREEDDGIIMKIKEDGVIKPLVCQWSSPVVLLKQQDGSIRFCVDYRQLNSVTKKNSQPLPRLDDTLDTLAVSEIFSSYWQVEIDPEDQEKNAFGSGLWQFTVIYLYKYLATFQPTQPTLLYQLDYYICDYKCKVILFKMLSLIHLNYHYYVIQMPIVKL